MLRKSILLLIITFATISNSYSQVNGYVLEVNDNEILLDINQSNGQVGDLFQILPKKSFIIHPATKDTIWKEVEANCILKIVKLTNAYSTTEIKYLLKGFEVEPGMKVSKYNAESDQTSSYKPSLAILPLQVSNIDGFLGVYVADMVTEGFLKEDKFKVLDRQALGMSLDQFVMSNRGVFTETNTQGYFKDLKPDYYITGTMYQPDVVEVSSGVPIKDMVKIAGFATNAIAGEQIVNTKKIAAFTPERLEVKKLRSIVHIQIKVIDAKTNELLFMCREMQELTGESEINLEGGMLGGLKLNGGASTFGNTLTGQATQVALSNLHGYVQRFFSGEIDNKLFIGNEIGVSRTKSAKNRTHEALGISSISQDSLGYQFILNTGLPRFPEGTKLKVISQQFDTSSISGEIRKKGRKWVSVIQVTEADFDQSRAREIKVSHNYSRNVNDLSVRKYHNNNKTIALFCSAGIVISLITLML